MRTDKLRHGDEVSFTYDGYTVDDVMFIKIEHSADDLGRHGNPEPDEPFPPACA